MERKINVYVPLVLSNRKKAGLIAGNEYPVSDISIGQSYTSVYLENFQGAFNSVQFEFYEDGKPLNIFRDRRFNPYLGV